MGTDEAIDALLRANYVRRRTRAELHGGWPVPSVFGLLFLLSLGPAAIDDRLPLTTYWLVAGGGALVGVLAGYRRTQRRTGASRLVAPEVATAVGLWAAALLLAGVGGYAGTVRLWWLYYPRVGWGLPVLGIVTLAPVGAPIAVLAAYAVAAKLQRSRSTLLAGLSIAVLLFLVGGVTLTLAQNGALQSVAGSPGGVGFSTLSRVGSVVVYRVVPTIGYALVLLGAGWVLRRQSRSTV